VRPDNHRLPAQRVLQATILTTTILGQWLKKLLDYFGVNALEELTSRSASRAIKSLQQNRRAA
jgi:hypothetical protein